MSSADRRGDSLPPRVHPRIGTVPFRNAQGVSSIAFSPNSQLLVSVPLKGKQGGSSSYLPPSGQWIQSFSLGATTFRCQRQSGSEREEQKRTGPGILKV